MNNPLTSPLHLTLPVDVLSFVAERIYITRNNVGPHEALIARVRKHSSPLLAELTPLTSAYYDLMLDIELRAQAIGYRSQYHRY